VVEYDGTADAIFSLQRRNKSKEWILYTRDTVDKLISFVITGRTKYTAATRHLSADIASFRVRRQDVVKLGTAAIRTFRIPPETGRCPICGPNPKFIVIDAQSLGCTDPDDTNPFRPAENCPVLDIPASKTCIIESPALRAAITKVLRSSAPLTAAQVSLLRVWEKKAKQLGRFSPEAAGAAIFFCFFPLGEELPAAPVGDAASKPTEDTAPKGASANDGAVTKRAKPDRTLESALRLDGDGNVVLGGKGARAKLPVETWRDRTGLCAPNFARYPRVDDGVWICVRPLLQAMLTEAATSMFMRKDELHVSLLANTMRLHSGGDWREVVEVVDDVGFVANFLGRFADDMDEDVRLRSAMGELLLAAVAIEQLVDAEFEKVSNAAAARGWRNAEYCRRWKSAPTPTAFKTWRAEQHHLGDADEDDPLISYEFFACLPKVRPGVTDSEAAKRRVGYKGKDKHLADMEGDGDACGKTFSVKSGLTQGVFNVICPHVITYGFRCLFQAESMGDALSLVLERFPQLPKVIFYDVACKIDKNSMRRVRSIFREQGVRCILDRPHSITHSCSPVYMPDECLGTTSGVATQAAEVSHSISVVNRTSLAYMAPATYMVHRMVQVAFMNLRKLYRLSSSNGWGENEHIPLGPFFKSKIVHQCERIVVCDCDRTDNKDINLVEKGEDSHVAGARGVDAGAAAGDVAGAVAGSVAVEATCANACYINSGKDANGPVDDEVQDLDALIAVEAANGAQQVDRAGVGAVGGAPSTTARVAKTAGMAYIAEALAAYKRWVGGAPSLVLATMASTTVGSKMRRLLVAVLNCKTAAAVRPRNKGRITLMLSDLQRLCGSSWLDDELMNLFAAFVNHRDDLLSSTAAATGGARAEVDGTPAPRTRMFNTFFFSRLSARLGRYDYSGVSRWGAKLQLNLEAVDTILIPVNLQRTHWVLVNINVKGRSFLYYDSFGTPDSGLVVPAVRRWLGDEVRTRLGDNAASAWDVNSWPLAESAGLPEQFDGGSSGVFVLAAADCFSLGHPLLFEQVDMPAMRYSVALALFFGERRCSAGLPAGCGLGTESSDDEPVDNSIPLLDDDSAVGAGGGEDTDEDDQGAGDEGVEDIGEGDADAINAPPLSDEREGAANVGWGEMPFEWDKEGEGGTEMI